MVKKNIKNKKPTQNKNVKATGNKNLQAKINEFEIKDIYINIFFAVITFLFFREILLQQQFLWSDFVVQYYAFRNFAAVTLSQGILPYWNPYTLGGMPFLADIQTAVFYPLHLLLTIFVTEDKLPFAALEYLLIFHYFMAGVFSYYLARSFDLNKWASILCGITFMFGGIMVAHAMHEPMIIQMAYLPLIFIFYNKGLNTNKLKYILLTGLLLGITILCGHPQITLYIFFTFLLFGLYQIFFKLKDTSYKIDISFFRFVIIAAIPLVIGIMIGAIQLLPTMMLSELSIRAKMTYEQTIFGSLNYRSLFVMFSPNFFGTFSATQIGTLYWGHEGVNGEWMHLECCIYVGLSTLIFGVFGTITLWKKRIVKFLFAISLFSILFALGDNFILYKFFYNFVPGFNSFRFIGRFPALVLPFCFSLLGAYGFDYFINNAQSEKVKKFIKYFMILVVAFILLWALYMAELFYNIADAYKDKEAYNNSTFQLFKTVAILLALFGLVVSYKKNFVVQQVILFFLILLSFIDFYLFGSQLNTTSIPPQNRYPNQKTVAEIKQEYKRELYRVKARINEYRRIFSYNQGMVDFIFTIDGYTPLELKDKFPPFRTNELMNVKYYATIDTLTEMFYFEYNKNYMPRAWLSYYPIVESSLERVAKILEDTTFDIVRKVIINQEPEIHINKELMGGGYG
jgi:hypothetical protein